ncbi:MAG: septal ring lytic transglycosylase RlpA family protein [Nitrospirota bacterium]
MNLLTARQGLFALALVLISSIGVGGCALVPKGHGAYDAGLKERGSASWYGKEFHGRLTASGQIYDQYKLTAAHRVLTLGSRVRVMNASNGRQVEVLINDRGPYIDGRIIDLSYAAAEKLDMIEVGTSPVIIEVITEEIPGLVGTALFALSNERKVPGTNEWASSFSTVWGSRYGDIWIAPGTAEQYRIAWAHFRDLRDERKSRRLSQFSEDLPPLQLQSDPIPDEHSESGDWEMIPVSV